MGVEEHVVLDELFRQVVEVGEMIAPLAVGVPDGPEQPPPSALADEADVGVTEPAS